MRIERRIGQGDIFLCQIDMVTERLKSQFLFFNFRLYLFLLLKSNGQSTAHEKAAPHTSGYKQMKVTGKSGL